MRHIIYIIILFVLSSSINAQDSLLRTNSVFITLSGGIPVIGNKDLVVNDYKIEATNPFFSKLSLSYIFKNSFGVYSSIKRIGYRYSFSENSLLVNNPDFLILKTDNFLEYLGNIYSLGITYKINYNRLLIFPNIGIGIRDFKNKYGGAVLKKDNSNTIRNILNLSSIDDSKVTLSMGLDLCYQITNRFGVTLVLDYDNFNPKLNSVFDVKEYNNDSMLEKDFNLNQNIVLLAFGFYIKI